MTTLRPEGPTPLDASLASTLSSLRVGRDLAYAERNSCVAFIAKLALVLGWPAALGRHPADDETWDREWMNVVFIEIPTGQLSWHIHDSELPAFDFLKGRPAPPWDGHTTEQKYERMRAYGAKPTDWATWCPR